MAKQTASFVDLHIEKIVLGAGALVLLATAAYYFFGSPYGADPAEVCTEAKKAADETVVAVRGAKYDPAKPTPGQNAAAGSALDELARWFGDRAEGLIKIAAITTPAPRTQGFGSPLLPVQGVAEEERHGLVKLVAPGVPIVTTGRSSLEVPTKGDLVQMARGGRTGGDKTQTVENTSWVSIGAQIDLAKQLENFVEARYPQGASRQLPIVKVHVQRRPADGGGDWEDVETYATYRPYPPPTLTFDNGHVALSSASAHGEFQNTIRKAQELIARPPMPLRTPETKGDEVVPAPVPYYPDPPPRKADTEQLANARIKDWLSLAQKAMEGKKPFSEPDPDAARVLAGAALATKTQHSTDLANRAKTVYTEAVAAAKKKGRTAPAAPQEPELLMPIVAHDLSVIEGQTYVYRMRYEILNAFCGNPEALKEVPDAQQLTLVSDWSEPSRPVDVKSDIYYFLTKDNGRDEVTFSIFKKVSGSWVKQQSKSLKVGDPVGDKEKGTKNRGVDFSTGMLCADIDFNPPGGTRGDVAVLLVNADSGAMVQRFKLHDTKDKRYLDMTKGR